MMRIPGHMHCGDEEGQFLHFDFYAEGDDADPISPSEANDLYWRLIGWLEEQGYGFDGGAKLGNWGGDDNNWGHNQS